MRKTRLTSKNTSDSFPDDDLRVGFVRLELHQLAKLPAVPRNKKHRSK